MPRLLVISLAVALLPAASSESNATYATLTGNVIWPAQKSGLVIDGHGGEVVTLEGQIPNALIGPLQVSNAYRVVYVSRSANASRIEVDGILAKVTDACIRAHAEMVIVHDTHCTMTGGPQSGGINMPFGLDVTGGAKALVANSSFDGFDWEAPPYRYWSGEGITIEKEVGTAEFHNVSANDNSDAGFDIKPFARLTRVSAANNCRNFRFWSGAEVGTLTTGDTILRGGISSCSGVWENGAMTGPRPRLHIQKLIVRMKRPGTIVEVETGPADIAIDSCDIKAPVGTTMIEFDKGAGEVRLGRGCLPYTPKAQG